MDYVTEPARLNKYTVSTLHEEPAAGDAFIVGIEIEALTAKEAAQKRFEKLSETERPNCLALLVKPESGGRPTVIPVKKANTPSVQIVDETTDKVGI